MQKPCFKHAVLNGLRDQLYLTATCQKATLIHLLILTILMSGPVIGVTVGKDTHSWAIGIITGIIGSSVGLAAAWLLPRVLWSVLLLFVRKGWFLLSQPAASDDRPALPVMTLDQFNARSKAFNREDFRQIFIILPVILVVALGMQRLAHYMDSAKPAVWVQILANIGFLSVLIGFFAWPFWVKKRLWRKHCLLCPACGRRITDSAGLVRVPEMGLCKHCGAKIVGLTDQDNCGGPQ